MNSIVKITTVIFVGISWLLLAKGVKAKETVSYIHTDHLGSTILVTDENGEIVTNQVYYPYGDVRNVGVKLPTEKAYTGQVSDEDETEMYYYNARYYSQGIAKFSQPDTISKNLNKYAYVSNNPISLVDPSGNMEADPGDGGSVPPATEPYLPLETKLDKPLCSVVHSTVNCTPDPLKPAPPPLKDFVPYWELHPNRAVPDTFMFFGTLAVMGGPLTASMLLSPIGYVTVVDLMYFGGTTYFLNPKMNFKDGWYASMPKYAGYETYDDLYNGSAHEAGHALVVTKQGGKFDMITIGNPNDWITRANGLNGRVDLGNSYIVDPLKDSINRAAGVAAETILARGISPRYDAGADIFQILGHGVDPYQAINAAKTILQSGDNLGYLRRLTSYMTLWAQAGKTQFTFQELTNLGLLP